MDEAFFDVEGEEGKGSEQRRELILVCDAKGRISHSNEGLDCHLGILPGLTLAQWHRVCPWFAADGMTPLTLQQFPLYRAWQGAVLEGEKVIVRDLYDHVAHTLLVSARPVYHGQSVSQGAMMSAIDISPLKQQAYRR
ncbi:hypothetical protein [Zobellella maritima]|uniref:hypothetical protein n=1 Tax=Zobellella maritima TaxID=2059725 RepID=UPI000E30890D|nr:hypothetical protein [Zobellella maritima]